MGCALTGIVVCVAAVFLTFLGCAARLSKIGGDQ